MAAEVRFEGDLSHLLDAEKERPCMTLEHPDCKEVVNGLTAIECSGRLEADRQTSCRTYEDRVLKNNEDDIDVNLLSTGTEPGSSSAEGNLIQMNLGLQCSAADKVDGAEKSDNLTASCCSEDVIPATVGSVAESPDETVEACLQSDCDTNRSRAASLGVGSQTSGLVEQINDAAVSGVMYSDSDCYLRNDEEKIGVNLLNTERGSSSSEGNIKQMDLGLQCSASADKVDDAEKSDNLTASCYSDDAIPATVGSVAESPDETVEAYLQSDCDTNRTRAASPDVGSQTSGILEQVNDPVVSGVMYHNSDCHLRNDEDNIGANLLSAERKSSSAEGNIIDLQCSASADKVDDAEKSDNLTASCYSDDAISATADSAVESPLVEACLQSDCDTNRSHAASSNADSQTSGVPEHVNDAAVSPVMYHNVDSTTVAFTAYYSDDRRPCPGNVDVTEPEHDLVSLNESRTDEAESSAGKASELLDEYNGDEMGVFTLSSSGPFHGDDDDGCLGSSQGSGECLNAANQQDDVAADVVSMETVKHLATPDDENDTVVRNYQVNENKYVNEYGKLTTDMCDREVAEGQAFQGGTKSESMDQTGPASDEKNRLSKDNSLLERNAEDRKRLSANESFVGCQMLRCEEGSVEDTHPSVDGHFCGAEHFQQIPCTADLFDDFTISQHTTNEPCTEGSRLLPSQSSVNQEVNFTAFETIMKPPNIEQEQNVSTDDEKEIECPNGMNVLASVCECLVNVKAESSKLGVDRAVEVDAGNIEKSVEIVEEYCDRECRMHNTVAVNDRLSAGDEHFVCNVDHCYNNSKSWSAFTRVFEEHDLDHYTSETYKEYVDAKNSEYVAQANPYDAVNDHERRNNNVPHNSAESVAAAANDDDDDDDGDSDEYETSCDQSSEPYEFSLGNDSDADNSSYSFHSSDEFADTDTETTGESCDSDFESSQYSDDVAVSDDAREFDRMTQRDAGRQDDQNGEHCTPCRDTSEVSNDTHLTTTDKTPDCNDRVNRIETECLIQEISQESFATVPDKDENESCRSSTEVLTECVLDTADQIETCAFGRKYIKLGILEGCGTELWWHGSVPEDHVPVENKYELQVPCDSNYNDNDDDDDDGNESDDSSGDDDVLVIDCNDLEDPNLNKTVHAEASGTDVWETASGGADYTAPENVAHPPSYGRQMCQIVGSLDHHESQEDPVTLKHGDRQRTFGIEDDYSRDLCGTSEDEVFYTDCEQKQKQERVEPRVTVVPATVDSDLRRKSLSSCDPHDKSEHINFCTDCKEQSEDKRLDVGTAVTPASVDPDFINDCAVPQIECEAETVDCHTLVGDDDNNEVDDNNHDDATVAASDLHVTIPVRMSASDIETDNDNTRYTLSTSTSDNMVKPKITGQQVGLISKDSSTEDGRFVEQVEMPIVSPITTSDDRDEWTNISTSLDQSTRCIQATEQVKLNDAFHWTSAVRTGRSPCASGKPDYRKMYVEGPGYSPASCDHEVLDLSISRSENLVLGGHPLGNHSVEKPVAAASSVASSNTNLLDYCKSLSDNDTKRPCDHEVLDLSISRSENLALGGHPLGNRSVEKPAAVASSVAGSNTNLLDYCKSLSDDTERRDQPSTVTTMRSSDDQTVDESLCNISSDELLYSAHQSPPSNFITVFVVLMITII